jgi:hypothetical protein
MAETFPPPRWAVPEIVAEGVTLLVGAPKVGKSWLALGVALAVAIGGKALGKIDVQQGPVLYLALEDTPRRLQSRLGRMLSSDRGPEKAPDDLTVMTALPGEHDQLGEWLDDNPAARLVVVDVFARLRGPAAPGQSAYQVDYDAVSRLKALADERSVAMVLVHHVRKAGAEDYLELVSGTHGLAGAADAVAVLKRSRGKADATLYVTGRDIEEAERALRFTPSLGLWELLDGPVVEHTVSDTRAAILRYVKDNEGATPKQIAEGTGLKPELVRQTVGRMAEAGQLDTDGKGHYTRVTPVTPDAGVTRVTPVTGAGESANGELPGWSAASGVALFDDLEPDDQRRFMR